MRGVPRTWLLFVGAAMLLTGCVQPAPPAPAELRTSPPPWEAPRDAVSYIEAAGLPQLPLNDRSDPHIITFNVTIDGATVPVVANIGLDRVRAIQAPVHTHDDSSEVWLEGQGNRAVTLGQFFTVWGVRFTDDCLGGACGGVVVNADGHPVADPASLVLRGVTTVVVAARS